MLPLEGTKDTTFLFMGDRWSFPKQASAATYVWQPLRVSGSSLSLPVYKEAWQVNPSTGLASSTAIRAKTIKAADERIAYSGNWKNDTLSIKSSGEKGASFSFSFTGTKVGLYGLAGPDGGYARISVRNSKGRMVLSTTVDNYCKHPVTTLKFLSPLLPKDNYTVAATVLGENWYWIEKS